VDCGTDRTGESPLREGAGAGEDKNSQVSSTMSLALVISLLQHLNTICRGSKVHFG